MNMKNIVFFLFLLLAVSVSAQDMSKRWNSFVDIDFIIPGRIEYHTKGSILSRKLDHSFTYGLNYSYEYSLLRKLSIGGVTGISFLAKPTIPSLKYGGILRFTFVEAYKANIYFQVAGYLPLNNRSRSDFGEMRLGLNFPISKGDNYNLTAGVYLTKISNSIKERLLEIPADPDRIRYNGIGFSIGVRF